MTTNKQDELDKLVERFEEFVAARAYVEAEGITELERSRFKQHFLSWHQSLVDEAMREARIDELKKITKLTFERSLTPENNSNDTWRGGWNFARNSLKRYKLGRIHSLKSKDKEVI